MFLRGLGLQFTLLPGKYRIKFLARDAETGRSDSSVVKKLS